MKTQFAKRALTLILGVVMLLSLVACVKPNTGNTDPVTVGKVTFPLEEEVTFQIMYKGDGTDITERLNNNKFWQDLYKATNVKVEFVALPADNTMSVLNAMFVTGDEGDAIISHFVKDADYAQLVANDLLKPLNAYIDSKELMPNFNDRVLGESPATLGTIASPDGNIYSLPTYTPDLGGLLESPLYINKAWLDQLDLDMPTTMEELEEVLIAFRDNDMDGDGNTDNEIPLLLQQGNSYSHFEAFMGLYGIATKDGTNENYVYLEDGKVVFAPTSEAYKDCIIQLNDWYEKELIWQEAFTSNAETWVNLISSATPCIGVIPMNNMAGYNADYVPMAPVKVEGYETSWYMHPGVSGVKTRFAVTRSCENVDILMAWIDMFYSYESSVRIKWGEESEGRYTIKNGSLVENTLDSATSNQLKAEHPTMMQLISNLPIAITADDYSSGRITKAGAALNTQAAYDVYKDYLNDEIWPRPYFSGLVSTRLGELRTDIFMLVNEKKAAWITGEADIEAEWDAYCARLKTMKVDELVKIMQDAYDNYVAANK